MKKLLFLLFGLFLFVFQSNAQQSDSIKFVGKSFYHGNTPIRRGAIKHIVYGNPEAYSEVKKGNSRITWAYIVTCFGAASLGGGIGSLIVGKEHENSEYYLDPLTGIGVGIPFIIGGILLVKSGAKKLANGIEIWNSKVTAGNYHNSVYVNFVLSDHGMGLKFRF